MNKKELKSNANAVGVAPLGDPYFEEHTPTFPKAYTNPKSKIKMLASDHKAITLIALVITIIIMLILVGVTVSIAINGGLFNTAKKAVAETQAATDEEQLYSAVLGLTDANTGKVDLEKLQEQLPDWQINKETGKCISPKGNEFTVGDYGNTKKLEYTKVSDIFDENGKDENADEYDPNKLHIGDFINYDAGTWTKEEIDAIKVGPKENPVSANNSQSLPNTAWQFGGFKVGDSRNKNATSYNSNGYLKDSTGNEISGWRFIGYGSYGAPCIVSAGCPEDYFPPDYNYDDFDKCLLDPLRGGSSKYYGRSFSEYCNGPGGRAYAMTLDDFNYFICKYIFDDLFNSVFGMDPENGCPLAIRLEGTRLGNLFYNNSDYWLAQSCNGNGLYYITPGPRENFSGAGPYRPGGYAFGIRIVIMCNPNLDISTEPVGKRTIVDPSDSSRSWTYNVWDIK